MNIFRVPPTYLIHRLLTCSVVSVERERILKENTLKQLLKSKILTTVKDIQSGTCANLSEVVLLLGFPRQSVEPLAMVGG